MPERHYRGFAAHFIGADRCRFHIATEIGDVIVSTVGAYADGVRRKHGDPEPWGEIGCGRKYETMVFRLGASLCECGCGERQIETHHEIDFKGYHDVRSATDGHEAMCRRWEHGIAPEREPELSAEIGAGE